VRRQPFATNAVAAGARVGVARVTVPVVGDKRLEIMNVAFAANVPHNAALGLEMLAAGPDGVEMRMPWSPDLVGNPETGVIHGGAVTSMVDAACGAAVFLALTPPRPIATLDLRIDHLRQATPKLDVICRATCERITTHIAFVRAVAHQGDLDQPVAMVAATFMIFREGQVRPDGGVA
jgi:uncharacterized protein (TIGR00369 family)